MLHKRYCPLGHKTTLKKNLLHAKIVSLRQLCLQRKKIVLVYYRWLQEKKPDGLRHEIPRLPRALIIAAARGIPYVRRVRLFLLRSRLLTKKVFASKCLFKKLDKNSSSTVQLSMYLIADQV
jgi:hypothetical protein